MAERKNNLAPETRQKLSDLAKQRHAEGRFGGAAIGSRGGRAPRKNERISKRVAEAAQEEENAKQIVEVFKDAIHESQPISIRLKGAQAWVDISMSHGKFELQEEAQDHATKSREELIESLVKKFTSGPVASILRQQIEQEAGIIDATVVESSNEVKNS